MYGKTPNQSICGPTTVYASDVWCEGYYEDPMASGITAYSPTITFETFNTEWLGCHTLLVTYQLSRYTSVSTSYKIEYICNGILDPPSISDKSYTIFSGSKTYSVPYFTINPPSL